MLNNLSPTATMLALLLSRVSATSVVSFFPPPQEAIKARARPAATIRRARVGRDKRRIGKSICGQTYDFPYGIFTRFFA